jgi:putative ABC transport system permease protein
MDRLLHDVRYAARMLAKSPAFTAVAVLTLGLGIGANAAIFSVVNAVLLRPLPFPEPERLVAVWTPQPKRSSAIRGSSSYPDFADFRDQSTSFEALAAFRQRGYTLSTRNGAERVAGGRVSWSLLSVLGVAPPLGRDFTAEDDRLGGPRVALLAHGLWQRRFAADPGIIGASITLDGEPHIVLGVLPAGFRFDFDLNTAELFTPLTLDGKDAIEERGQHYLRIVGRLKPGTTSEQARAELAAVAARLEQAYPRSNTGRTASVVPLHQEVVGDVRRGLLVLLGAVALVLLVSSANVANLLLVRATEREREVAVRSALGASRGRLGRQFLTESVLLALLGGGLGLLFAFWGVAALVALAPADLPRAADIGVDGRVLGATLGVSLLTGLLFGSVPSLRGSRVRLAEALSEGGRGSAGPGRQRVRNALIVTEVALAVVLLVGAGLLLRSLGRLLDVDPGFRSEGVLTANLRLPDARYEKPEQVMAVYDRLLPRLASLPGVTAAGAGMPLHFGGDIWVTGFVRRDRPEPPPGDRQHAHYKAVTPGYLEALGIPLVAGRLIADADRRGAPRVVVVSRALAHRLYPDEDPVGRPVAFGVGFDDADEDVTWRIVGVVGDTAVSSLDVEPPPQFYVPLFQQPWGYPSLVLRTAGNPRPLIEAVRREVQAIDSELPVFEAHTLGELTAASVAQRRFQTRLLAAFAAVGLLLAAVGLYGVMAVSVGQRTREIGIRIALGAERRGVIRLVMGQGLGLVLLGMALGLAGAAAFSRVLAGLLFRVGATDPVTFAVVPALLAATALAASYLPARRATRVDPLVALRCE